ncbi:MAG: cysteine--tRNA ligase [Actinomycetota bacterium]|nr:cysteine--tRNA ligase [Actinomycetota bacterium]
MAVRIYDSKLRAVVPLETRDEGRVAMYCCGPTVYNYIHVGNARTFVWFDAIRHYLGYRGYDVTYVMNYTDVDDKIIERANLEGLPPDGITKKYERAFEDDMAALGAEPADVICRATDHVSLMVEAIEGLVDKGLAYDAGGERDGDSALGGADVFFAVDRFEGYGSLSGRSLDDMRAGERIEPHERKRHPLDFALWKSAKEGEPSWPSPWGPGRPGWHIECSVMSTKYLGMGFDVHGGASDLIFPHHENELAQAEGLAGTGPFVRHWLHAGLVQMDAEKMSKSLGNFVLAHDLVQRYDSEAIRYWMLAGSYRSQAAFTDTALDDAVSSYARWKTFADSARHALGDDMPAPVRTRRPVSEDPGDTYVADFVAAMDDDFNSAGAFAVVHDLVKEGNRRLPGAQTGDEKDRASLASLVATFQELTGVLGFRFPAAPEASGIVDDLLDFLLEMREEARAEKAYARSDAIRDRLASLGVAIEDTPAGPRWRVGGH